MSEKFSKLVSSARSKTKGRLKSPKIVFGLTSILCLSLLASSANAAKPSYRVKSSILGTSFGLNENNVMAIYVGDYGTGTTRLWDTENNFVGPETGIGWGAYGVNKYKEIVGYTDPAFLYDHNGNLNDLSPLKNAVGLNDDGDVSGSINTPEGEQAAMWIGGNVTVLANLPVNSRGNEINNNHQIVGTIGNIGGPHSNSSVFFWENGIVTPIPEMTNAYAINQEGSVAGNIGGIWGDIGLWDYQTKETKNLGYLSGYTDCIAYNINDQNKIVGPAYKNLMQGGEKVGFLWQDDKFYNLNGILTDNTYTITDATDINNKGFIAATGFIPGQAGQYALLLAPTVPEPTSMLLLASGLIGVFGIKKRKNN